MRSWIELFGTVILLLELQVHSLVLRYHRSILYHNRLPSLRLNLVVSNYDSNHWAVNIATSLAKVLSFKVENGKSTIPVAMALSKMRTDINILDKFASKNLNLYTLVGFLFIICMSGALPLLLEISFIQVILPFIVAVLSLFTVYTNLLGKVSTCNGIENAKISLKSSAESEAELFGAKSTYTIIPLCFAVAAASSYGTLLAESVIHDIDKFYGVTLSEEFYLLCPLAAVLAASIAGLATQEAVEQAEIAKSVGSRRFASAEQVGRTWKSVIGMVNSNTVSLSKKWAWFTYSVAPAPLLAFICPGTISFKAIVCATWATSQAAYYRAMADSSLASAVESVSVKNRASSVAGTYARQGLFYLFFGLF